jgi:cbb3-type cytochrome oxidase maturation protein
MATSTIVWIVIAVVAAVLVLAALTWAGRSRRNHKLHGEAERIRGEVEQESDRVGRRAALADETAAKARAAKAEAEVKAAEAARLDERAQSHRSSVETSRDDLDERRAHADSIDPAVKAEEPVEDVSPVDRPRPVEGSDRAAHHRR